MNYITVIVLSFSLARLASAATPEEVLQLCVRDGNNMLGFVDREMRAFDEKLAKRAGDPNELRRIATELSGNHDDLERYRKRCVDDPSLKGLSGYATATAIYGKGLARFKATAERAQAMSQSSNQAASAGGPSADSDVNHARWKNRPDRCRGDSPWRTQSASRVKGVSDDNQLSTFEDTVARLACGYEVIGISDSLNPKREPDGDRSASDLIDGVYGHKVTKDHQILYRGLLAWACFHWEGWDAEKHYSTWAVCNQGVGKNLTADEVERAFESVYPGRDFEKKNVGFLVAAGFKGKAEVDAAFRKYEASHPMLKEIYWASRLRGMEKYAKDRQDNAAAYALVDAHTERLAQNPDSPPTDDCEVTLEKLRGQLLTRARPKNEEQVFVALSGSPLSYQITEALSHCYLGKHKAAKALREAKALRRGLRRVTPAEATYYETRQAEEQVTEKMKRERLEKDLPGYSWPYRLPYSPLTYNTLMANKFEERARAKGNFKLIGKEAGKPAVIESFVDGKSGVTIKFKKVSWKVPDPEMSCSQTNKIDHFELSNNRITPHYQTNCRVTKMRWQTVTYQEKPIVVPKEEKKLLRVGEWPEIEVNSDEEGDAAVVNVFQVAGQQKGKQVAFVGVRVD